MTSRTRAGWLETILALALIGGALSWALSVPEAPEPSYTASSVAVVSDSAVTMFYGMVTNPAREYMEQHWTDSTYQVEHGYCATKVRYYRNQTADSAEGADLLAVILDVAPAETHDANDHQGIFSCPGNQPLVHTHPPITCQQLVASNQETALSCERGGYNAYECEPSRQDYQALQQARLPFGVIQCDRHAFVFYWSHDYYDHTIAP